MLSDKAEAGIDAARRLTQATDLLKADDEKLGKAGCSEKAWGFVYWSADGVSA
jgi:hypothetical protein